jgi:Na+-transporting methylmalonyl-CoA/oxaloacetate decarboxylase beta subunit
MARFGLWVVVGAVLAFAGLSLQVGLFLVLIGVAVVGWRRPASGAIGALAGSGCVALYVALINRAGPGASCVYGATTIACDEQLDPVPWLIAGLALIVISVAVRSIRTARLKEAPSLSGS